MFTFLSSSSCLNNNVNQICFYREIFLFRGLTEGALVINAMQKVYSLVFLSEREKSWFHGGSHRGIMFSGLEAEQVHCGLELLKIVYTMRANQARREKIAQGNHRFIFHFMFTFCEAFSWHWRRLVGGKQNEFEDESIK